MSAIYKGVQVGEVLRLWNRVPHQEVILSFLDTSSFKFLSGWIFRQTARRKSLLQL